MPKTRRGIVYAIAFLVCTIFVWWGWFFRLDVKTTFWLQRHGRAWLDLAFFSFTLIGGAEPTLAMAAALSVWRWRAGRPRTAVKLWIIFVLLTLLELALKYGIGQPRPPEIFDRSPWRAPHLIRIPSPYSFPSGHTLRTVFLFGYLGYLLVHDQRRVWWRSMLQTVLWIGILLMCVSRVYLGDHWASDVIGGYLLGCVGVWCMQQSEEQVVPQGSTAR